jgi:hypothetical protein
MHRNRITPARVFRVMPDPDLPFIVEVRIAKTRMRMLDEMRRIEGESKDASGPESSRTQGLVRSWFYKRSGVPCYRPRGLVARMYLNTVDLRNRPSEIVAHECTHAGMAWARLRGAKLEHMPGEEVLAHAVGQLVRQVNTICYAHRVWE